MDEILKKQLKERGLLPIKIDKEAQEFYRSIGLDPLKVESHYTPGTPSYVIERLRRIEENVLALHEMELKGDSSSTEYVAKEQAIKTDLFELYNPTVEDCLREMATNPLICGVNRDIVPFDKRKVC